VIDRAMLQLPAPELAPVLLGAVLASTVGGLEVRVRMTEVEAYAGEADPASHAYRGRTPRNEVMYGAGGALYCYFVYGMHWCANVTCGADGAASAVLLRAGDIIGGESTARSRTPGPLPASRLASGPARLARVLGLTGTLTGLDLLAEDSVVRLSGSGQAPDFQTGPRVGVSRAADVPWRFWIPGRESVSQYRAARRRAVDPDAAR
jgi:DNA-3-methyladenine glycosylase